MVIEYCPHCGSDYEWSWEEAFDKFGFMDGDGLINTFEVEDVLIAAGYEVELRKWGLHNILIRSIKLDGIEMMPQDNQRYVVGYDDPRDYLPKEIIVLLDKEVK